VALESAYAGEDVRSNYRLASLSRNVTLVVGLQGAAGSFWAYDTVPCTLTWVVAQHRHTRCRPCSAFHALQRPVFGRFPWPGPPPGRESGTAWQAAHQGATARSRPGPGPRQPGAGDPRSVGATPPRLWPVATLRFPATPRARVCYRHS